MSTFKKILILLSVISIVQSQKPITNNQLCVAIKNGMPVNGTCTAIMNCPTILAEIRAKKFDHTVCRFVDQIPIVCCINRKSTVISDRMPCKPIAASGGIEVEPGEYTHMAALGYILNDKILWNCGGSLINDRYVLTAAHCLKNRDTGPVQIVRLGTVNLRDDDENNLAEDFEVARLIPHPDYKPRYVYNDIGLIELAEKVNFTYRIRAIGLPRGLNVIKYFKSMGWGATGPSDDNSVQLTKIDQELFSHEECQSFYIVGRRFPNGIMHDTHICAGSRNSNQSTCQDYSGGPLISVRSENDEILLVIDGIVSFGNACGFANTPVVYTKVYPYIGWIVETIYDSILY